VGEIKTPTKEVRMLVCEMCGREYEYNRKAGHTYKKCNSCCDKIKNRSNKQRLKSKAVEYKGGKCSICGYDKCMAALEFHHLDKEAKEFSLSNIGWKKWETIKAELDKCSLVCSNCHKEIHYPD
jgi:hypothetical protein